MAPPSSSSSCSSSSSSSSSFFVLFSSSCFLIITIFVFSFLPGLSHGQQVLAPNVSSCHLPLNLPSAEEPFDCCAPFPNTSTLPLFQPPPPSSSSSSSELRVRRRAHAADESYAEKLARGYALMRELPSTDPRSFYQQANIHCAYCNTVYNQQGSDQPFQVHGSWLFFPFHRWYLYFHERILGWLLDDDDFALPFWNYDVPEGAAIPWIYANYSPQLNDSRRDPSHLPPAPAAIDFNIGCEARSDASVQLRENAAYMYRTMIRDPETRIDFFGKEYRRGDSPMPGYGTIEQYPHNTIHVWAGTSTEVGGKDMGSLYAAARDPVFYAHHAQLDRLWELWKNPLVVGRNNSDIDDDDAFLDAEFAFYDERAEMVRVRVRDCLRAAALGYRYEDAEIPWAAAAPARLSGDGPADIGSAARICEMGAEIAEPCSVLVVRDPAQAALSPSREENLVLGGLGFSPGASPTLNVFVNLPSADAATTSGALEFVGVVMVVPQFAEGATSANRTFRLGARVRDLGLADQTRLVITLVPLCLSDGAGSTISVATVFVQYPNVTDTSIRAAASHAHPSADALPLPVVDAKPTRTNRASSSSSSSTPPPSSLRRTER